MVKDRKKIKKFEIALAIGLIFTLAWGTWSLHSQQELADKVVRLHILANSDSDEDQALKLKVRDVILDRAEEILENSKDRREAETALKKSLPELKTIAAKKITQEGYSYPVTAELEETEFPTKEYGQVTLPAGKYLALRIVIGSGEGHNWWCVVFPPLCAESTTDVSEAAMAAGLSKEDVNLMTEENGGYVLKFKSMEIWDELKERLSELQDNR